MISGFVLLDKPGGVSSHEAVREVSRLFGKVRAGHAGTLDPLATGMLPVLLGEATRFSAVGLEADKSYEVEIDLSIRTDSLDVLGRITDRFTQLPSADAIREAVRALPGQHEQVPPAFSAISVQGRRAYTLARAGKAVDLPARRVTIHDIRMLELVPPAVRLWVRCSKGTYIRAMARDLGAALNAGGCVSRLRRVGIGSWTHDAMLDMAALVRAGEAAVRALAEWLRDLPEISLDQAMARRFLCGQRLPLVAHEAVDEQLWRVGCGRILLGCGHVRAGYGGIAVLHPGRTLPSAGRLLESAGP